MSKPPETRSEYREWAHAPSHLFLPNRNYIVTCGIYEKAHILKTPAHLDLVKSALFAHAKQFNWQLEAWAILVNHYHFVATSPEKNNLDEMLQSLHSSSARELNELDKTPGRKVWWNYRDTCLTNTRSYYSRLHYVHYNPARHGVVGDASNYAWCSMGWFLRGASPGFRRTVLSFKIDQVNVPDDF